MSCVSGWQQFSRQPVIVTLNLRGRLVNSLLPSSRCVNSSAIGVASNSSLGVIPPTGQPQTPRTLSIPVCMVVRPTASSCRQISGTSPIVNQRICTCCRVVRSQKPWPNWSESCGDHPPLAEFMCPAVERIRSMKLPGVCLRKNRPRHFIRWVSSSVICFQSPEAAWRSMSVRISRGLPFCLSSFDLVELCLGGFAAVGRVCGKQFVEQHLATPATGAGLASGADGFDRRRPGANAIDDVPLRDAMAVTDVHVVGECHRAARAAAASSSPAGRSDDREQFERLVGHGIVSLEEPHEQADIVAAAQVQSPR